MGAAPPGLGRSPSSEGLGQPAEAVRHNIAMAHKLTRREWVASVAVPALAQAPAEEESPEQLLARARQDLLQGAERLGKFPLPMAVEPAFVFKP
jgi:hypothetical protein